MSTDIINIVLLGASGVGKSCLHQRYRTGVCRSNYITTVLIDQFINTIMVQDKEIKLIFWDTAGQERYHSMITRYLRIADGVVLVYDVNKEEQLSELNRWLNELRQENETAEVIIAGNKIDLVENKQTLDIPNVEEFVLEEKLESMRVSAKTGENVEKLFNSLIEKILVVRGILQPPGSSTGKEQKNKEPEKKFSHTNGTGELTKFSGATIQLTNEENINSPVANSCC